MHKRINFFLISFFWAAACFSQTGVWVEQTSGVTVTLTSATGVSDFNTGWICGYNGTVLRTTNSGVTWLNVSGNGLPATVLLINISAVDQNTAITAGYIGANTFVYKTSNAGANWTQVFTEANGFIDAICMDNFTPATGLMMGDPVGGRWSLWKTSDAGSTWDSTGLYLPQVGTEAGWNNAMFRIGDKIWFGTNNTRVYYSSDYGSNWTAQPTTGEINSYAVWMEIFSSSQDGLTGGATLLQTSNYGSNWSPLPSTGSGNFGGITGGPYIITDDPNLNMYYVRTGTSIYKSTNSGLNWSVDYTASAGNYRYIGNDNLATRLWAVRDNGGISSIYLISGISQINSEVPAEYTLKQNYPNPFNPSTTINFSIPKSSNVSLKIYDAIGKEVATLVNEFNLPEIMHMNLIRLRV